MKAHTRLAKTRLKQSQKKTKHKFNSPSTHTHIRTVTANSFRCSTHFSANGNGQRSKSQKKYVEIESRFTCCLCCLRSCGLHIHVPQCFIILFVPQQQQKKTRQVLEQLRRKIEKQLAALHAC